MKAARLMIGLDGGAHVGYAVWDPQAQKFVDLRTGTTDLAWDWIWELAAVHALEVFLENPEANPKVFARKGQTARAMLRIGRNVGMVQEATRELHRRIKAIGCDVTLVPPRRAKKIDSEYFNQVTGWTGRTSQHARDAGMLVWGRR